MKLPLIKYVNTFKEIKLLDSFDKKNESILF